MEERSGFLVTDVEGREVLIPLYGEWSLLKPTPEEEDGWECEQSLLGFDA